MNEPSSERNNNENHSQKVMKKHDQKVLALRVHEYSGVDRMKIEATFNKVKPLDLVWYLHTD